MKTIFVISLICILSKTNGQTQSCPITDDKLEPVCKAIAKITPNKNEQNHLQLCGCVRAFLKGDASFCKVTQEAFQDMPKCYKTLSSDVFKTFVNDEKTKHLNRFAVQFLAHTWGLCGDSPSDDNIENQVETFFRSKGLIKLFDLVLEVADPKGFESLSGCLHEFADIIANDNSSSTTPDSMTLR